MILRRIADAWRTLADGNPTAAEARFRRLSAEATDLIGILDSALEKLAMQTARQAKRRSRADAKEASEEEETERQPAQRELSEFPPSDPMARQQWKAEMRSRMTL